MAALYKALLMNTGGRWIRHATRKALPLKEVNALIKKLDGELTERQKKVFGYKWRRRNVKHLVSHSEEREDGKWYFVGFSK